MSDKIQYTTIPGKGRAVVSTKLIKEEEIIMEESPLVAAQFAWNKEYGYLCCDHCMLPLETAQENVRRLASDNAIELPFENIAEPNNGRSIERVQCNSCEVPYCSSKCLINAQTYHSFECNQYKFGGRFYEVYELWKKSHYPPETATIALIIRIFGILKNKSCTKMFELIETFCKHSVNEDLQICHKMLGMKFSAQLTEIHQAMHNLFAEDEELAKYVSYDGFIALLSLIGTNAQGIGTSSFANWVQNISNLEMNEKERNEIDEFIDAIYSRFNDTVGEFLDNEGSGLYVNQSRFNHSCQPNAQIIFPSSNFTLNVVALKDINPENEICISYIDECMLSRSRHSRQKYLMENYLFKCTCEKCNNQSEEPDVTSDEDADMETDED